LAALRSASPYAAFARALELFYQPPRYAPGIHPTAIIAKGAKIGESAHIGPYCYVDEKAEIGRNAVLHSSSASIVVCRLAMISSRMRTCGAEYCRIGNRVVLQDGVIVGGDGFGFAKQTDGSYRKSCKRVPSCSKTTSKYRQIRASTGLPWRDAHRTRRQAGRPGPCRSWFAGRHEHIALRTGRLGRINENRQRLHFCRASRSGRAHHRRGRTVVTAQSGIPNDLAGDKEYAGTPCVERRQWLKNSAALNRTPELQKRVRELEAEIEKLKSR